MKKTAMPQTVPVTHYLHVRPTVIAANAPSPPPTAPPTVLNISSTLAAPGIKSPEITV